jgi:aryl-alcohol dehydrogenase-like predicted oxidoreductase
MLGFFRSFIHAWFHCKGKEEPKVKEWKIAKALGISEFRNLARFDTLQAYYSIAGRDLEREIVPLLESEKVGLLVWSPLAGGLPTDIKDIKQEMLMRLEVPFEKWLTP